MKHSKINKKRRNRFAERERERQSKTERKETEHVESAGNIFRWEHMCVFMLVDLASYRAAKEPGDTQQPCLRLQQDFITYVKGGLNTHGPTSSISPLLSYEKNLCWPFMRFFSVWNSSRQRNHNAKKKKKKRNSSEHAHKLNTRTWTVANPSKERKEKKTRKICFCVRPCIKTATGAHTQAREQGVNKQLPAFNHS